MLDQAPSLPTRIDCAPRKPPTSLEGYPPDSTALACFRSPPRELALVLDTLRHTAPKRENPSNLSHSRCFSGPCRASLDALAGVDVDIGLIGRCETLKKHDLAVQRSAGHSATPGHPHLRSLSFWTDHKQTKRNKRNSPMETKHRHNRNHTHAHFATIDTRTPPPPPSCGDTDPLLPSPTLKTAPPISLHSSAQCPAVHPAAAEKPANRPREQALKAGTHSTGQLGGPDTVVGRPIQQRWSGLIPPDLRQSQTMSPHRFHPTPFHTCPAQNI